VVDYEFDNIRASAAFFAPTSLQDLVSNSPIDGRGIYVAALESAQQLVTDSSAGSHRSDLKELVKLSFPAIYMLISLPPLCRDQFANLRHAGGICTSLMENLVDPSVLSRKRQCQQFSRTWQRERR
jgi:hypothetical protein